MASVSSSVQTISSYRRVPNSMTLPEVSAMHCSLYRASRKASTDKLAYAGGDRFDNPPSWAIRERVNSAVSPNSRASSTPGQKVWRTIGHPKVLPQRQNAAHLRLDGLL